MEEKREEGVVAPLLAGTSGWRWQSLGFIAGLMIGLVVCLEMLSSPAGVRTRASTNVLERSFRCGESVQLCVAKWRHHGILTAPLLRSINAFNTIENRPQGMRSRQRGPPSPRPRRRKRRRRGGSMWPCTMVVKPTRRWQLDGQVRCVMKGCEQRGWAVLGACVRVWLFVNTRRKGPARGVALAMKPSQHAHLLYRIQIHENKHPSSA